MVYCLKVIGFPSWSSSVALWLWHLSGKHRLPPSNIRQDFGLFNNIAPALWQQCPWKGIQLSNSHISIFSSSGPCGRNEVFSFANTSKFKINDSLWSTNYHAKGVSLFSWHPRPRHWSSNGTRIYGFKIKTKKLKMSTRKLGFLQVLSHLKRVSTEQYIESSRLHNNFAFTAMSTSQWTLNF